MARSLEGDRPVGGIGKRIFAFWRPHGWLAAGLLLTMLLKTVFTVVLAFSLKLIIDAVVEVDSDTSIAMIAILLVAGFVISAGAGIANGYLAARAGADILAEVRTDRRSVRSRAEKAPLRTCGTRSSDRSFTAPGGCQPRYAVRRRRRRSGVGLRRVSAG